MRRCIPHLLACTILLSCAAKTKPLEIEVEVRPDYKGALHVTPCSSKPGRVRADDQGRAYAGECPHPGQEVVLVVIRGGQTYRIPAEKLTISKTGDGIPVEVMGSVE